jgi:hypothetical protein
MARSWLGLSDVRHYNLCWINAFPLQLKLGREGVFKATIAFMKLLGLNIILRKSCKISTGSLVL